MRLDNFVKRLSCMIFCFALMSVTVLPLSAKPASAGDPAITAMTQFKAKQYKLAAASFHKAIAAKPSDANLYYYYALCLHYCNDINGAKTIYNQILQYFPGTDAATRAGAALGSMGPANPQPVSRVQQSAPNSAMPASSAGLEVGRRGGSGGTIVAPDECNIRFERVNNSLVLDTMVNNRPIKMIFDTGAEMCAFGRNNLQDMSIPAPTGPATGKAGGVGSGGVQDTWDMPVTLTVGPITRKNFNVCVQQEMGGQPLLGQTFFQDFTYTIDNGANNIHLRRKNKAQGSIYQQKNDPNAVPFTRMGNEIIVVAEINRRPCQVIFDTGANVCAFTRDQVKSLGITIPEDAQKGMSQGIAGSTMTSIFPVSSMKLGPIEKRDFDIHVVEDAKMPAPLLGQTFYGDWQFTIDYENKVIHFLRR